MRSANMFPASSVNLFPEKKKGHISHCKIHESDTWRTLRQLILYNIFTQRNRRVSKSGGWVGWMLHFQGLSDSSGTQP